MRFHPGVLPLGHILLGLALAGGPAAADSGEAEFPRTAADVNRGELHFLEATPPGRAVHHFRNHLTVEEESLVSGWVRMHQCHENLDPVPDAQIVYGAATMRGLQVESVRNIGRAWVENSSVQMQDIQANAQICVSGVTQALKREPDGHWALRNGPYMRRFLDGYYPIRVSMAVTLETRRLRFIASEPEEQPGFRIWRGEGEIGFDTLFEGVLRTTLRFAETSAPSP